MSARLAPDEVQLLFRLHRSLMFYVNEQLEIVSGISSPEAFASLPPETRVQVRDALVNQPELIDRFVQENPVSLSNEEPQIVQSWRHFVAGQFFVFRHLKNHTIFLSEQRQTAYGVLALSDPFEDLIGPSLPVLTKTISFGGGVKRRLNETYKEAKERMGGIVTSLPEKPQSTTKREPQKKAPRPAPRAADVRPLLETIVAMTDNFCREYLNDEYAALCRKLADKLARKRPSPLLRGKPVTWASGIVRTIGWVNFLNDPTQTPHMQLKEIDERFGISESTGAARLKEIRTTLRLHQLDPQWSLPSRMDENPLVWMLEVDGLLIDARHAPRNVQEFAFEQGLIPYIPGDRE